jgi:endonuclease-8
MLEGLIAESHRLLRLNRTNGERRTIFGLNPRERVWVYGRSGEPCRVCGETIRMRRQGVDARSTYYCPRCQGVSV